MSSVYWSEACTRRYSLYQKAVRYRRRPNAKRRDSNNLYCLNKPVRACMLAVLMAFTCIVGVDINLAVSSDRSTKQQRLLRPWPLHEFLQRTHLFCKSQCASSKPYALSATSTTPILQSRLPIWRGSNNRTVRRCKCDSITKLVPVFHFSGSKTSAAPERQREVSLCDPP